MSVYGHFVGKHFKITRYGKGKEDRLLGCDHLARVGDAFDRHRPDYQNAARGDRERPAARVSGLFSDDLRRVENSWRRRHSRAANTTNKRMGIRGLFLLHVRGFYFASCRSRSVRRNFPVSVAVGIDDRVLVLEARKQKVGFCY